MTAQSLPFAASERFHTHDLDEARAKAGDTFAPHGLHITERGARLDVHLNGVTCDRIGLYYVDYGAEIVLSSSEVESGFLVEIPLAGAAEVSCGREQIVTTPERASVLSPMPVPLSMRWRAGTPQLATLFDRPAIEAHLSQMLGRELRRPLVFSLGMDLTRPSARSWLSVVYMLRREAETNGAMLAQPLAVKQLEELLMTQLLLAQPNNYTPALLAEQPRVAPPT
ncbi:cupin domain-containing protein, partial [Sphaerimonospora thailandensis]|uniref:cupin domain-containing protein n=1 Tax=Sphaerimonospora thailandensis TaxID=795644 RepID=UPI00194E203D